MKMAVAVYRRASSGMGLWSRLTGPFGSILKLRRRCRLLQEMGHQPLSLGESDSLEQLLADCRRSGADVLWITFSSSAAAARGACVANPYLTAGLTVYADGLVSSTLPPTRGQQQVLSALGLNWLADGEFPPLPVVGPLASQA